jgi:hypothetical protein
MARRKSPALALDFLISTFLISVFVVRNFRVCNMFARRGDAACEKYDRQM